MWSVLIQGQCCTMLVMASYLKEPNKTKTVITKFEVHGQNKAGDTEQEEQT